MLGDEDLEHVEEALSVCSVSNGFGAPRGPKPNRKRNPPPPLLRFSLYFSFTVHREVVDVA